MKHMLAYSSIGQIRYAIIGIIIGDSNDGYTSMITYMLFYISMNLGIFTCIVSFGLYIETNNIRASCVLSLVGLAPLAFSFFGKTLSILVWMEGMLIFLDFDRTPYECCLYLLLSKNNQVINDSRKPRNNPSRVKL
ncbi:hypothetical protein IEQ34_015926 [Dendrobium chrysotoxum]|uniref:NADH:quinone oxidoreductase/Mrp antiporter transmembrane domain-containing protein n=1 Tax=Dendrobium chrysotoxum TaxID=161865 RepID=A0AAV7G246_DENCH|nr:hypothetical protein IEQ34_015926 [Dendrobium chrysotoxum]